jgi:peptidoglycan/LPS O-acetylase OafA/YrhL
LGGVLTLLAWVSREQVFFGLIFSLCVAYFTFYFSFHPKIRFQNFARFGDFSYGLYVFAFPIQQLLARYMVLRDPYLNFLLSFPLVLGLAILSWHWVEKPALALKKVALGDLLARESIFTLKK